MKLNIFKFIIFSLIFSIINFSKLEAKYIFVSNENSDTIAVLDLKDKSIVKIINTGGRPRDMKFSLDKSKLYVVVSEENHIAIIDIKKLQIVALLVIFPVNS